jgi:hypothetical protein
MSAEASNSGVVDGVEGPPTAAHLPTAKAKPKKKSWFKRFARQELRGWSPIITAPFILSFYACVSSTRCSFFFVKCGS